MNEKCPEWSNGQRCESCGAWCIDNCVRCGAPQCCPQCCLVGEVERLESWVADLQSGMYVNCVYCGHRYGPNSTTPVTMADALKAHIEQCPQHPMSALKVENMGLRAIVDRLPKTADGFPVVPGMTVFIPHPRPSNLITEREVVAPYGSVACLTKEPAHSGCCESTAHRQARECYSTREAALAAKETGDANL